MVSVFRIVAAGLAVNAVAVVGWLGYWEWPTVLTPSSHFFLWAWVAVGLAVAFGSVARRHAAGPRRGGTASRWLAVAVLLVGAGSVGWSVYRHGAEYQRSLRAGRGEFGRLDTVYTVRGVSRTDVGWVTLGVGGLAWVTARAAGPRPRTRSGGRTMATALRLLAGLLMVVGVGGFVAAAALCSEALADAKLSAQGAIGSYLMLLLNVFLAVGIAGLGGLLWVGVRLAYPNPAAPTPQVTRV